MLDQELLRLIASRPDNANLPSVRSIEAIRRENATAAGLDEALSLFPKPGHEMLISGSVMPVQCRNLLHKARLRAVADGYNEYLANPQSIRRDHA